MRIFTVMVAVAALASIAWANGTPPMTVPASPAPSASAAPVTSTTPTATTGTTTTTTTVATTDTTGTVGTTGVMVAGATMTTLPGCPANISSDTACLVNELRAARAEVRATALEMRGQMLVDRMNQLQAKEMIFRQMVSANPTTPADRQIALQLQAESMTLNNDIAAFNRELSLIPAEQRPYLAQSLNAFEVAYWQPATQQFAQYRTNYQQVSATSYQPAFANNTWLQNWHTNYNTSLNTISTTQQTFATTRWWTTTTTATGVTSPPQVLGSTETYPGAMSIQPGSAIVLPAGSVIIVPQTSSSTVMAPMVLGTTQTMSTGAATNGYPAGTGAP